MAKKKTAEDPVEFTPDKSLTDSVEGASEASEELAADEPGASPPAETPAAEEPATSEGQSAADDYDGTLASGNVDEKGRLTVNLKNGRQRMMKPGEFEALGNDRVKFKK